MLKLGMELTLFCLLLSLVYRKIINSNTEYIIYFGTLYSGEKINIFERFDSTDQTI